MRRKTKRIHGTIVSTKAHRSLALAIGTTLLLAVTIHVVHALRVQESLHAPPDWNPLAASAHMKSLIRENFPDWEPLNLHVPRHTEAYRFIWLPSFNHPRQITVVINGSRAAVEVRTRHEDKESIVTRTATDDEVTQFRNAVLQSGFLNDRPVQGPSPEDGATWWIEHVRGDAYVHIGIHAPKADSVRAVGNAMIALAPRWTFPDYIY